MSILSNILFILYYLFILFIIFIIFYICIYLYVYFILLINIFFYRIFYDIEFGRIIDVLQGHEDAVSCLALSTTRQIIISGSWDCTAKVWQSYSSGTKIKPAECLIAQLDHDSKVTCINISG